MNSYELVLSMTKAEVHKLLKNIHKSNERIKKEKDGKEGSDEDGDESEEEEKFATQPERYVSLFECVCLTCFSLFEC